MRLRNVAPERQQVARDASSVIKQAASILQRELTESSASAGDMQRKFAATKRVDRGEFKQLADRVRNDVHDLIAIMGDMFTELKTDEVQSLVSRMADDAHEVVDTTMNLVEHTPEAASRFAAFGFTTPIPTPTPSDEPTPVSGEGLPDTGRESPEPADGIAEDEPPPADQ
jgi:hypothetical protein